METASSKCAACVSSLETAWSAFKRKDTAESRLLGDQSGDELERLSLWMGNIGVLHLPSSPLSLESRLKEAKDVLDHILELLDNVYEAALDLQQLAENQGTELDEVLGGVILNDGDDDNDEGGREEEEEGEDEATALIQEIGSYITRLFRATKIIRQAAPTDRFTKAMTRQRVKLNDQFDIAHVGEKYPKLAETDQAWLRQRLGRAITHRRQFLRYAREHKEKLEAVAHEEAELAKAATKDFVSTRPSIPIVPGRASGSQPSTFFTKATTINPAQVTSALLSAELASDQEEDARSYTTISRSVDGDLDSSLSSRIPPLHDLLFIYEFGEATFPSPLESTPLNLPLDMESKLAAREIIKAYNINPNTLNAVELRKVAKNIPEQQFRLVHRYAIEQGSYTKKEIECPFCRQVKTFKNDRMWRRHVYADLRPYVCTFADCDAPYFTDVNEWFRHEMQSHRVSFSCRLCGGKQYHTQSHFLAHVKKHHPALILDGDTQAILDISKKPLLDIPAADCPCCTDWLDRLQARSKTADAPDDIHVTTTVFKRHLASHLEQLALFALPLPSATDGDMNSNLAVEKGTDQDRESEQEELQFDSRPHSPVDPSTEEQDQYYDRLWQQFFEGCNIEAQRCDAVSLQLQGLGFAIHENNNSHLNSIIEGIEGCARLLLQFADFLQIRHPQDTFTVAFNHLNLILPCLSRTLRDITSYWEDRTLTKKNRWRTMYHKMTEEAEGLTLPDRFKLYEYFLTSAFSLVTRSPNADLNGFEEARVGILHLRKQRGIPPPPTQFNPRLSPTTLLVDKDSSLQFPEDQRPDDTDTVQRDQIPGFNIETEDITDPGPASSQADSELDESVDGQYARVYELRHGERDWFDRGIGFCKGVLRKTGESDNDPHLIVWSEDNLDKVILQTKVDRRFGFKLQSDDVIVWSEPSDGDGWLNMALSFKESDSCSKVWGWTSKALKSLEGDGDETDRQPDSSFIMDDQYFNTIRAEILNDAKTRRNLLQSFAGPTPEETEVTPEQLLESIACSSRPNALDVMHWALKRHDAILGGKPKLTEAILMIMVANRDHAARFVWLLMGVRPDDVIVTVDVLTEALGNYLHTRELLRLLPLPKFGVSFLSSRMVTLAARRAPLGLADFFEYLCRWARDGGLSQDDTKAMFRRTMLYLDAEFGRKSPESLIFRRYCADLESRGVTEPEIEGDDEEGDTFRVLNVLVVDDHPVSRLVLEGILDQLGCLTTSASNGPEAMTHLLGTVKFDIAFLEPRLPRISGADVALLTRRGSKRGHINTKTPMVAVSAHEDELPDFHGFDGFDSFLQKPATSRKVIEILSTHCKWKPDPRYVIDEESLPNYVAGENEAAIDKEAMDDMLETARAFLEAGKFYEAEASLNVVISNPLIANPQGDRWREHPSAIEAKFGLARLYLLQERYLESVELCREVVNLTKQVLGEDHPDLFDRHKVLAMALKAIGNNKEACEMLAKAIAGQRSHLGADDTAATELASLLDQWKKEDDGSAGSSNAWENETPKSFREQLGFLGRLPFSRRRKAQLEQRARENLYSLSSSVRKS